MIKKKNVKKVLKLEKLLKLKKHKKNIPFIERKIQELINKRTLIINVLLLFYIKKIYKKELKNLIKTYINNKNKFSFILKLKQIQFLSSLLVNNLTITTKKFVNLDEKKPVSKNIKKPKKFMVLKKKVNRGIFYYINSLKNTKKKIKKKKKINKKILIKYKQPLYDKIEKTKNNKFNKFNKNNQPFNNNKNAFNKNNNPFNKNNQQSTKNTFSKYNKPFNNNKNTFNKNNQQYSTNTFNKNNKPFNNNKNTFNKNKNAFNKNNQPFNNNKNAFNKNNKPFNNNKNKFNKNNQPFNKYNNPFNKNNQQLTKNTFNKNNNPFNNNKNRFNKNNQPYSKNTFSKNNKKFNNKITVKKKKINKKIAIVKIKFSRNNMHATISNKNNKVLKIITCGAVIKKGRKRIAFAIRETMHTIYRFIRTKQYRNMQLHLKGLNFNKYRFFHKMGKTYKINFYRYFKDSDGIPHNGCKLRKAKRK